MKDRPILYNAPMVRATLEDRKTQTRRVIKEPFIYNGCLTGDCTHEKQTECDHYRIENCPYGQPGDRLWVRETWQMTRPRHSDCQRFVVRKPQLGLGDLHYAATHTEEPPPRWRPSIHMPRWASRITLEITGVRVERLQDISEADAKAEGCDGWIPCEFNTGIKGDLIVTAEMQATCKEHFQYLWESIDGPGSWDLNPYVWVIEFKRIG